MGILKVDTKHPATKMLGRSWTVGEEVLSVRHAGLRRQQADRERVSGQPPADPAAVDARQDPRAPQPRHREMDNLPFLTKGGDYSWTRDAAAAVFTRLTAMTSGTDPNFKATSSAASAGR
jgi:hypothetical protein